jgi:hypothetical protein
MKRVFIILLSTAIFAACETSDKKTEEPLTSDQKDQAAKDSANFTSVRWTDSTFLDLGSVKKGQVVEVSFPFENSGDKNLIITNVTASCGCTIPETPQEPFAPGKGGVIKAKFDSNNQSVGEHRKNVTVSANTEPKIHLLSFRVQVTE